MLTPIVVVLIIAVATGILSVLFKLLKYPLSLAFKLFLNMISGFIFLFVFNFIGSYAGITLGLNWINALIVGILGIPGVGLLLLIRYFI